MMRSDDPFDSPNHESPITNFPRTAEERAKAQRNHVVSLFFSQKTTENIDHNKQHDREALPSKKKKKRTTRSDKSGFPQHLMHGGNVGPDAGGLVALNTRLALPKPGVPVISDHFVARRRVAIGPLERTDQETPNARAAAHANMLPQRMRHACSTGRLNRGVSDGALA